MVLGRKFAPWTEGAWFHFSFRIPITHEVAELLDLASGLWHLTWLSQSHGAKRAERSTNECHTPFHRSSSLSGDYRKPVGSLHGHRKQKQGQACRSRSI